MAKRTFSDGCVAYSKRENSLYFLPQSERELFSLGRNQR